MTAASTRMRTWHEASNAPPESTWCLCYCRIPAVRRNGVVTRKERYRYLVLEFAEGEFWVNRGVPDGFVLCWSQIDPPAKFPAPLTEGVRTQRLLCSNAAAAALKNAAEQFIASCGDGNVVEMLDYFFDIFTDALSPASAARNSSEGAAA